MNRKWTQFIRRGVTATCQPQLLPLTLATSLTIFVSHFLRDGHNDQRLAQLLLLAGASLYVFWRRAATLLVGSYVSLAAMGVLLLAGVASGANAAIPSHAFLEVGLFAILYLLALGIAAELARDFSRGLTIVLYFVGAMCLLYELQIIAIYVFAFVLQAQPADYAFGPNFSNFRFFNHAQTITLPLLLLLYCRAPQHSGLRRLWLGVTGLWWALIIVLAAKGTFIAIVAACALVLALRRQHAREYVHAAALTGATGLLIYALFFIAIPLHAGMQPFTLLIDLVQGTPGASTGARLEMWQRAASLFAASPLLGIGPMHFAHYGTDLNIAAHLHSWLMQLLTEWGALAFVACLIAMADGVRCLLLVSARLAPSDLGNQTIATTWMVLGAALLMDGLVSGLIVMPVSQLLIVLYLGCAMAWGRSLTPAALSQPRPGAWTVRVLLLAAGTAVVVGVLNTQYVTGRPVDPGQFVPLYPMTRFWLPGHF